MSIEVSRIEDGCELGSPIVAVGTKVAVELVQRLELGIRCCALVGIGGLVDDADSVVW